MLKSTKILPAATLAFSMFVAVPTVVQAEEMSTTQANTVDDEQLATTIRTHVFLEDQNKVLTVKDEKTGQNLKLSLDDIDGDHHLLAPGKYVKSAEFTGPNGEDYTLDFWVEGQQRKELKVTNVDIREVDGVERYEWSEKDGVIHRMDKK
ncbi:MAG: hypothetical protein H6684_16685 [Deltaproteobacteria bacterium]|nr:hypothetical protein [Deltaproteobacteria bacterium]MCB9490371.1 hypothetical protein [Deltaproteobacteria bacterium]